MTTAQRAQQAIDAYLAEARRANGDEYADATRLYYHRGWFKLQSPWFYNEHYHKTDGLFPWIKNMRLSELEQITEGLKARPDHEGREADK